MKELKDIKFWLFDLDNTLYSGATEVFEQVDKKMTHYISGASYKSPIYILLQARLDKSCWPLTPETGGSIALETL